MKKLSDTITLIYIRNKTGEPHSIEVSAKGAKMAVIAIAVIMLLSTLTSFLAVNLYLRNDRLAHEMNTLHGEKKILEEKLLVMERALVEDYKKETGVSTSAQESPQEDFEEPEVPKLRVDGLKISKADEQNIFRLTYKVVNIDTATDEKVKGYMVITCKRDYDSVTVPDNVKISNGRPLDIKSGESFSIRYFKPVDITIPYPIDTVRSLYVWFFDDSGKLLLRHAAWEK